MPAFRHAKPTVSSPVIKPLLGEQSGIITQFSHAYFRPVASPRMHGLT